MRTGVYYEDGWMAEVEILEDNSDEEWKRYKLKVIRTIIESELYNPIEDGTVFEVSRRKGVYYAGMWQLYEQLRLE